MSRTAQAMGGSVIGRGMGFVLEPKPIESLLQLFRSGEDGRREEKKEIALLFFFFNNPRSQNSKTQSAQPRLPFFSRLAGSVLDFPPWKPPLSVGEPNR